MTSGIFSGVVFGVLFGGFMGWITRRQTQNLILKRPDFGQEKIILEGPANHFAGGRGTGGYLFLTDTRILFISPRPDAPDNELCIPLSEVESVMAGKRPGMLIKGIQIRHGNDHLTGFVVNEHHRWRDTIIEAKAALGSNA